MMAKTHHAYIKAEIPQYVQHREEHDIVVHIER
jgi:hypothetical protein